MAHHSENAKLCVICCSFYLPSTSTTNSSFQNHRHHLSRFCKELQIKNLEDDHPPPLNDSETGTTVRAVSALYRAMNDFKTVSICPQCVSFIASAMAIRDKATVVENRVRQLQKQLLEELRTLRGHVKHFQSAMGKIEDVILDANVFELKEHLNHSVLPEGDEVRQTSVLLNFRDRILNAMEDLKLYKEELNDKVNCVPSPPPPTVKVECDIETIEKDYDIGSKCGVKNEDEQPLKLLTNNGNLDENKYNFTISGPFPEEDEESYDDGFELPGVTVEVIEDFDDENGVEVKYEPPYLEGYSDDEDFQEENDDNFINMHQDQGQEWYTPPQTQSIRPPIRGSLPQARNKPPGVTSAYFSWMEFEQVTVNGKRKLLCDICKRPMSNKQAVLTHKWTHLNGAEAAEAVASGGIDPRVRYLKYKAEGRFNVKCPVCGRVCSQSSVLSLHMRIHQREGLEMICPGCTLKFNTEEQIVRHQAEICFPNQSPCFQCPHCGYISMSISDFEDHMDSTHAILRPFRCSECGLGFSSPVELRTHTKEHQNRSCKRYTIFASHINPETPSTSNGTPGRNKRLKTEVEAEAEYYQLFQMSD